MQAWPPYRAHSTRQMFSSFGICRQHPYFWGVPPTVRLPAQDGPACIVFLGLFG